MGSITIEILSYIGNINFMSNYYESCDYLSIFKKMKKIKLESSWQRVWIQRID